MPNTELRVVLERSIGSGDLWWSHAGRNLKCSPFIFIKKKEEKKKESYPWRISAGRTCWELLDFWQRDIIKNTACSAAKAAWLCDSSALLSICTSHLPPPPLTSEKKLHSCLSQVDPAFDWCGMTSLELRVWGEMFAQTRHSVFYSCTCSVRAMWRALTPSSLWSPGILLSLFSLCCSINPVFPHSFFPFSLSFFLSSFFSFFLF